MKPKILALAFMIAAALALPSLADTPAPQPADITINITDKAGKPIEAAQISVLSPDGSHIDATTDAHGKATLSGYDGKPATVLIAHPDYVGATQNNAVLKSGATVKLATQPNVGSIIFPEGKGRIPGLSGTIESVLDPYNKRPGDPLGKKSYVFYFYPHVESGKSANYTSLITGTPATLTDEKQAHYRVTPQAFFTGPTIMITYEKLAQTAAITLTITDKAGKPIEAAQISVLSPDGSHSDATTDAHGKAALYGYDGKPATVIIAHPDYVGATQTNAVLKNGITAKLNTQRNVGSIIFPEGYGKMPGLAGSIGVFHSSTFGDPVSQKSYGYDFFPQVPSGQISRGVRLTVGAPTTVTDENQASYRITPQALPTGKTVMITYEKLNQPNTNK